VTLATPPFRKKISDVITGLSLEANVPNLKFVLLLILELLVNLFSGCISCVKWNTIYSASFSIDFGVRQGSVLSPILFALYSCDVSKLCTTATGGRGCIILYADDILLIAPSVTMLERLLHICEDELDYIDMVINCRKSCCIRIGPRYDVTCANIGSINGLTIRWSNEMRYLGVYIVSSRLFKCFTCLCKEELYRGANAIFGKIGRLASEEVVLQLIKSKCIPILLHGLEPFDIDYYSS